MEKTTFDLEEGGAALTINKDLTTEIIMPKVDPEAYFDVAENRNVFLILAISVLLEEPDFIDAVDAKLEEMFEDLEED